MNLQHRYFTSILTAAVAAAALSGCAVLHSSREPPGPPTQNDPRVVATFHSAIGRTVLIHKVDGTYDIIGIDSNQLIPLHRLVNKPKLLSTYIIRGATVTILQGESIDCPQAYLMVMISHKTYITKPAGDCVSSLSFEATEDGVVAVQEGASDPLIWWVEVSRSYGPVLFSVIERASQDRVEQQSGGESRPQPASDRRSASPGPRTAGPRHASTKKKQKPTTATHPKIAPPALPPQIKPVGEDVIPSQVAVDDVGDTLPTIRFDELPPQVQERRGP